SSFAQTERKEDTETVSYANLFSYAFVGNFLVLSSDPASVRKLVDSYLKHETLATDPQFRNSTRWQPRPAYGQLYISPALMESYRSWAEQTATNAMYMIGFVQEQYKRNKGAGSYGTLEQLVATNMVPKEMFEGNGYKIEVTVSGDKFEVFAVPVEYGKTGTLSYYMDQTRVLRGADRGGASATSSDPPIR